MPGNDPVGLSGFIEDDDAHRTEGVAEPIMDETAKISSSPERPRYRRVAEDPSAGLPGRHRIRYPAQSIDLDIGQYERTMLRAVTTKCKAQHEATRMRPVAYRRNMRRIILEAVADAQFEQMRLFFSEPV